MPEAAEGLARLKSVVGAFLASVLASMPLWVLVPVLAVFGIVFLLLVSPLIIAAGAALISWLVMERAGVRGPALWIFPLLVSLLVLLPAATSSAFASSLGLGSTMVEWFSKGPGTIVCMGVAAFALLFLFSAVKLGPAGAIIGAVVGGALGVALAVGQLGMGQAILSVSTEAETASIHVYPLAGAVVGASAVLLTMLVFGKE